MASNVRFIDNVKVGAYQVVGSGGGGAGGITILNNVNNYVLTATGAGKPLPAPAPARCWSTGYCGCAMGNHTECMAGIGYGAASGRRRLMEDPRFS